MSRPARARLDADDRLLNADEWITALNRRAGGTEDRLVLAPILTIGRLARRLGVVIARPVRLADGETDLEAWLRAEPEAGGAVRLTLADWRSRPAAERRHPAPAEPDPPAAEPLLPAQFAEPLRRALDRPVRRIVATAELIREDGGADVPQTYRDYARDIANAGRHLQALLEDLVTLNGVEEEAPAAERVDLAEAARRAADLLTVRAAEAAVTVQPPAGATAASGDFRRILQIAVNLIGNAVDHSPTDGRVTVSSGGGPTARLTVDDEGPGVPVDQRERIFDQFVRLDPEARPGSGLGLYISRRLARAMGGDIRVSESPMGGARFTLTLPTAD